MPTTPHIEKHFTSSAIVRDIVIGMSDGLTVPFALAAGLTGAVDTTAIIITAGIAEIAAGSIAMGLGGYLAGKTDIEHFETERAREIRETEELPEKEEQEVAEIFESYGLEQETVGKVVKAICADRKRWVDFMMRFELGLEEPDPKRALRSASTIAGAYIAGGLIPLAPYMLMSSAYAALIASVIATIIALAAFGAVKGHYTGMHAGASALRTALIGGVAAAAAFGIARLVSAR